MKMSSSRVRMQTLSSDEVLRMRDECQGRVTLASAGGDGCLKVMFLNLDTGIITIEGLAGVRAHFPASASESHWMEFAGIYNQMSPTDDESDPAGR